MLVLVDECKEPLHPTGPHHHVKFTEFCEHGKPLRYECFTCTFGGK